VHTFAAWSPLHGAALIAIGALCVAAIHRRRRATDQERAARMERAVARAYVALWIGTFVWLRTTPDYDPTTDWPLQLCHWTALLCALALATPRRAARALAYFWGLALCTQALITPNLTDGPATWPFWFFWTTHAMCVGVPVYDVAARGYRPRWGDWAVACAAAAGYVAIVLPIDLATGWNYGFVGPSRPDLPTLVDFLGPWPARLASIAAIAGVAMALLMLPSELRRAVTRTRGRSPRRPRA
jgi:hypothetical integral membrane protein (TIGR02206 family)